MCVESQAAAVAPELRLNLDGDGVPEEIIFYDPETGHIGRECLDSASPKGRRALALLILHTAKERKRRVTRKSKISLPKSAAEFASTLAEEVTNPNRTKCMHWLEALFGVRPNGRFLFGARRINDLVHVLDHVAVIVSDYQDSECSVDCLQDSFDRYCADESKRSKQIEISLHVRPDGEHDGYEIRSHDRSGSICSDDEFSIMIRANYSTSLTVFWITTSQQVQELYPSPDQDVGIDPSCPDQEKVGFSLRIPGNDNEDLNVDDVPGVESCVIVASTSKLGRMDKKGVEAILQGNDFKLLSSNSSGRPRLQTIKRGCSGKLRGVAGEYPQEVRVKKSNRSQGVATQIMDGLPATVTSLRLFQIPHV